MKKEYKLLKKYPSLPNDWEVGMIVGLGDRAYSYSPCNGKYSDIKRLDNSEVENNPEFWEVYVEPLEFEILRLEHPDLPFEYKLLDGLYYSTMIGGIANLKLLNNLHNLGWKIKSVKRLFDGEIFTLGDKIFNDYVITNFNFDNTFVSVIALNSKTNHGGMWNLTRVLKRNVLFTTIDNVEICLNDEFYVIDTNNFKIYKTIGGHFTKDKPNFKRFKEQTNAESYVINNKPILSLNEVKQCLKGHLLVGNNIQIELDKSLLNLVKEKLNGKD